MSTMEILTLSAIYVSIAAICVTIVFSIITLCHSCKVHRDNKKLQEKQINASLYDKRFELLNFYVDIGKDLEGFYRQDKDTLRFIFVKNKYKIQTLFSGDIASNLIVLNQYLYDYINSKQLPDYTKEAQALLKENNLAPDDKTAAFFMCLAEKIRETIKYMELE